MLLQEKLETFPFSTSERKIVDYMLTQKRNIQEKTTGDIAKETFSSKSTLVRLAQKMNYQGWNDLKEEYINELNYLEQTNLSSDANFPFKKNDSIMTVAHSIAKLEKETIDDTLSLLTHDCLRKAISIMNTAKKIHVFAVSSNLLLIDSFQHKMKRIKKEVCIHKLQSEILFDSYLAEADSCAILISYSGETTILSEVANFLHKNNVAIIAFTSLGENTLSREADVVLRLSTREKLYSKISSFSTDTAIEYLLNLLFSCIFKENYDENLELKLSASKYIEKDHFSTTEILKENELHS